MNELNEQMKMLTTTVNNLASLIALSYPSMLQYMQNQHQKSDVGSMKIDNLICNSLDIAKNTPKQKEDSMPYVKKGYGSFYKRKSDGRWAGKYVLNGKAVQTVIGRNVDIILSEHYRIIDEWKKQPRKVNNTPKERHTLFSLLDKWFAMEIVPKVRIGKYVEKGKISASTEKGHRNAIKHHLKKHYPDKLLNELIPFELQEASMKIGFTRVRESADTTLNMALKWAHAMGLMKKDIRFKVYKHEREKGNPFSRKDQNRILEYAKKHSSYYFHFMVYFWTGCRPSELLEIRHCDFDFFNGTIFIDGTKTKTSSRKIPLFKPLYEFKNKIATSSKEKVFTCLVETLRYELERILDALKIDKSQYTLKSTRHSFATRMRENGIDIKVIAKWLGHTNLTMTDNYSHVLDEFEQQQAQKVNALVA